MQVASRALAIAAWALLVVYGERLDERASMLGMGGPDEEDEILQPFHPDPAEPPKPVPASMRVEDPENSEESDDHADVVAPAKLTQLSEAEPLDEEPAKQPSLSEASSERSADSQEPVDEEPTNKASLSEASSQNSADSQEPVVEEPTNKASLSEASSKSSADSQERADEEPANQASSTRHADNQDSVDEEPLDEEPLDEEPVDVKPTTKPSLAEASNTSRADKHADVLLEPTKKQSLSRASSDSQHADGHVNASDPSKMPSLSEISKLLEGKFDDADAQGNVPSVPDTCVDVDGWTDFCLKNEDVVCSPTNLLNTHCVRSCCMTKSKCSEDGYHLLCANCECNNDVEVMPPTRDIQIEGLTLTANIADLF